MRIKELLDNCYNDFIKIIGKVIVYDGPIKEVPYGLINHEVIGISVTVEDRVKLVVNMR